MKKPRRAFVILLAGVLVLILTGYLLKDTGKAYLFKPPHITQRKLHELKELLNICHAVTGTWPTSLAEIPGVRDDPTSLTGSQDLTKDGWGHSVRYDPPSEDRTTAVLTSLGRDGQPGGTGQDQDIVVHVQDEKYDPDLVTWLTIYRVKARIIRQYNDSGRWAANLDSVPRLSNGFIDFRNDGWGRRFEYVPYDPSKGTGWITSYGRDGAPGGTGDDKDTSQEIKSIEEIVGGSQQPPAECLLRRNAKVSD